MLKLHRDVNNWVHFVKSTGKRILFPVDSVIALEEFEGHVKIFLKNREIKLNLTYEQAFEILFGKN